MKLILLICFDEEEEVEDEENKWSLFSCKWSIQFNWLLHDLFRRTLIKYINNGCEKEKKIIFHIASSTILSHYYVKLLDILISIFLFLERNQLQCDSNAIILLLLSWFMKFSTNDSENWKCACSAKENNILQIQSPWYKEVRRK